MTAATIALGDIDLDMNIYPRADWSLPTVERYVEALNAGDEFPPIILENGTDRLLDGMHRYQAHRRLGREEIKAEWHEIPAGVPPLLYAASLSARHGDRLSGKDLQAVVRKVVSDHPDFSMVTAAKYCGVARQTVSKWASDITDRRRAVRQVKALLLSRLGWAQEAIAKQIGVSQRQVSTDLEEMSKLTSVLNEDLLREAVAGLPMDLRFVLEEIREERIFAAWSDDERDLLKRLRAGETLVLNMRAEGHPNLMRWADDAGLFVRIDRRTDWGNPFELPADGDRETVIANYADHYLPYKPSLLSRLDELRGKALGCWCAPESCHGDILKARAEE